MKSLTSLLGALLHDCGNACSTETARDLAYAKKRARHEGVSFYTITLSNFAEDIETGLRQGRIDSTLFAGWRKRGCLPAFLQGFTSLVFGLTNGEILDEPCITAIHSLRQICRFFKKVRIPCTSARERKAFESFKQTEADLCEYRPPERVRLMHFQCTSRLIWGVAVFGSEAQYNGFGLVPKHGPGATAERTVHNGKYVSAQSRWHARLEQAFPVDWFKYCNMNHALDDEDGMSTYVEVDEESEQPVRVITVPKTLKSPRIIAIEPVCMQYTQQAVLNWMVPALENSRTLGGAIRFTDQTVNQQLAMEASRTGRLATIDLSEASDRVPVQMVKIMLRECPDLLDAILACRSRRAELPDGTIIDLKKFSSMGSALCFPIESMYFFTIIVHAILWKRGISPTLPAIRKLARQIHIYGDDIIIPVDEVDTVIEALRAYACKVNTSKSFWTGKFRESCGCDAFDGVDVTPIYLREMRPQHRRNSTGILSWVSTSNQLYKAGMWRTADVMKTYVEQLMGTLPIALETTPGLCWTSFQGVPETGRMCKDLHVPMVKTYKVKARRRTDPLDGYPALLKYLLRVEGAQAPDHLHPSKTDARHLASSARCGTVSKKRQWVPVH